MTKDKVSPWHDEDECLCPHCCSIRRSIWYLGGIQDKDESSKMSMAILVLILLASILACVYLQALLFISSGESDKKEIFLREQRVSLGVHGEESGVVYGGYDVR